MPCTLVPGELPERHRGRGGHVERVHAPAHGDDHPLVAGGQRRPGQARTLGAEQQRRAAPGGRGQPLDGQRVVGRRQGQQRVPRGAYGFQRGRPGFEPGVGHREHLAHAHPDAAPVQRVGARGGQQHGVHPERGGAAEHGPEVGVVVDVFEDRHPGGRGEHGTRVGQRPAVERREDAPVDVEPGGLRQHLLGGGVERGVDVGYLVDPLGVDEQRAGAVPGPQRPAQHQLTFGDEQPVRRLPPGAQLHVGQRAVVGEPLVVRVGDGDGGGHPAIVTGCPPRLRGQACSAWSTRSMLVLYPELYDDADGRPRTASFSVSAATALASARAWSSAAWLACSTGSVVMGPPVSWIRPPSAPPMPSSALVSSAGTIHTLLDWPAAICGSACRYWYARTLESGLAACTALKTVWIALAWPSACRMRASRSPCARRIAPWRSPSAVRICDCLMPSALRIAARRSRSARICFSIESRIDGGGSIALISTRVTLIPQRPVVSSSTPDRCRLISSRLVSAFSRSIEPMTLRRVVTVSCSIAWRKLAISYVARTGSTTL